MSARPIKLVLPIAALATVIVVVYLAVPKPAPPTPPAPATGCVPPPGPFFASAPNVEVALTQSIKVLKAQATPQVLDVIPKEARSLEMIAFMTCKAHEQKMIQSSAELMEYTRLLADVQAGRAIAPYVRHLGALENLDRHLRTTPSDNFQLVLRDPRGLLPRLEVDELSARDWTSWFEKFCSRYAGCVTCTPQPNTVTVLATSKLQEVDSIGKKVVRCAA